MSAIMFDCRAVAQSVIGDCRCEVNALKARGIMPRLGVIRVGAKGPDLSYERGAIRTMGEAGIDVTVYELPANISRDDYVDKLCEVNADPSVHGILALRPLDNIDESAAIGGNLSALKDVDSCTPGNLGRTLTGDPAALRPCTAEGVLALIDYYADDIRQAVKRAQSPDHEDRKDNVLCGLNVCILNRTNVIGKPLAMMLANRLTTVTVLNRRTPEEIKREICRSADLVIVATPFRSSLTADMIREGAVVIDAGIICEKLFDENGRPVINEKTGRQKVVTYGSAAEDVKEKAALMTPVPGMGAITSAMLCRNLVKACKLQNGIRD